MSTPKNRLSAKSKQSEMTPLIGSLLRFPREVVVTRMFEALNSHGFDISLTELSVFMHPGPEGRRPADLARQCNMTRQAMNYVLSGLEQKGFVQRQAGIDGGARVVSMTDSGWEIIDVMRQCVLEIEREWTGHLGAKRFKALSETLQDLSRWLNKLP